MEFLWLIETGEPYSNLLKSASLRIVGILYLSPQSWLSTRTLVVYCFQFVQPITWTSDPTRMRQKVPPPLLPHSMHVWQNKFSMRHIRWCNHHECHEFVCIIKW